jgi:transmembrane sensor
MAKLSDKPTLAIIEAANEWLVKLNDDPLTEEDELAFDAWLRESPTHVREYLRAESIWSALEGVDIDRRIDLEALLRHCDDNVLPLTESAVRGRGQPSVGHERRHRLLGLATAATVVVAVLVGWLYTTVPHSERYVTKLGEQRRLVLDDGSIIDMNTQSELTVRLADDERYVYLLSGEALFTVARDPARPFVVASDLATVRALGTQFNVHRQNDQMRVSVLEGRVSVASRTGASLADTDGVSDTASVQSVEFNAGDAAELRPGAPIKKSVHHSDVGPNVRLQPACGHRV